MAGMSNYLEETILNTVLRGESFPAPDTVYLALFTTNPTDADEGTEVNGGAYVRQPVGFFAPFDGEVTNNNEVLFPIATSNWGEVTHIGLYDSESGGNLLFHGQLNASKVITEGTQFKLPQEYLSISID